MGNNSEKEKKKEEETIQQLSSEQKTFSREELSGLMEKFKKKYSTGYMTKQEFITENISLQGGTEKFWDEVFIKFTTGTEKTDRITFADFIVGLTSITKGTDEEKLSWMFNMYDLDGNKTLDRQEINSLVHGLVKANDIDNKSTEDIKKMAENFFKEMDSNGDGQVDLSEFIKVSLKTPFIKDSLTCVMTHSLELEKSVDEFSTFENQVAGHKGKSAMLKDPTGKTIFKPLHPTEFEFYQSLNKHPQIQHFFPKFFGRKVVEDDQTHETTTYLQMENLTDGLVQPCICDLKMGFKGYDHTAGKLKIAQQVALCAVTTSSSLGFRMCGMRYFEGNNLIVRDKPWGARLTKNTMQDALISFLVNSRFEIASVFAVKLKELLKWFNEQKLFKFFSSSILLIYDAVGNETKATIKVVDFAHTFETKDDTIDDNYREGLVNLVNIIDFLASLSTELYENQRKKGEQWSKQFLTKDDPSEYSNENGTVSINFRDPNSWVVDRSIPNIGDDGWQYSLTFKNAKWHSTPTSKDQFRRRKWTKKNKDKVQN